MMDEKIETIIEQVPLGIITFSCNGDVEFVNQNFRKFCVMYQFTSPYQEFNFFEEDLFPNINIKDEISQVLKGVSFEKVIRNIANNNGGKISVFVKGSPIYEEDKITGGILLIDDIKIPDKTEDEIDVVGEKVKKAFKEVNSFFIITNNE